jgi:hypothetical protein
MFAAAMLVMSAWSYAGATSTISAPLYRSRLVEQFSWDDATHIKFNPSRPRKSLLISRIVHPPGSGVPARGSISVQSGSLEEGRTARCKRNGSAKLLYGRVGLTFRRFCCSFRGSPDVHYVQLADGTILDLTQYNRDGPAKIRCVFTTSKDNQVTATLRLSTRYLHYEELIIEGLTPRPKGGARIKVTIERDLSSGERVATIQELGSNLDVSLPLREASRDGIRDTSLIQYSRPAFGIDGVIGELPE